MTDTDAEARAAVAERAARAGAAVAEESFRQGIAVETKTGKTDFVTQADRDAQRQVIAAVREEYPEDAVVGEEEGELKSVPDEGSAWVIDPVDGTNNYVRDIPVWGTAVAATVDGEAVAAATVLPEFDDVFAAGPDGAYLNGDRMAVSERADPDVMTVAPTVWWDYDRRAEYAAACREIVERFGDMRRFGCAQASLAMVAAGSLDGVLTNILVNPWDSVAGAYMVERAGGTVTDLAGDPWRHDSRGLVASNGRTHGELLAAARAVDAVR